MGEISDHDSPHRGLGYMSDFSPKQQPNSPAFLGPLVMPGTNQCDSKPSAELDDEPSLADTGLFGTTPSCDINEFTDVGGGAIESSALGSTSAEGSNAIPLEGPVYGPVVPWQSFSTTMETSNCEIGDVKGQCTFNNLTSLINVCMVHRE